MQVLTLILIYIALGGERVLERFGAPFLSTGNSEIFPHIRHYQS